MVQTPRAPRDSYDLSDYVTMARRRWAWIVVGVILGIVAGNVAQSRAPESYESTASVLVKPTGVGQSELANPRTRGTINLDTESQLVRSFEVATRAKALLRSPSSPAELAEGVSVTVPPNSEILTIGYEAATPEAAARGAHAFAEGFLANRTAYAKAEIGATVAQLESQAAGLAKQLQEASDRASAAAPGSADRAYAEAQRGLLVQQVSQLNASIQDLKAAKLDAGRIVSDSIPPITPAGPGPRLFLLSGALVGLLLGLILAVARERVDGRLHTAIDVERDLGVPVLVTLPRPTDRSLLTAKERNRYDRLRNIVSAADSAHEIVLLTGADESAPVEEVCRRLVRSLTSAERSAILVDAVPTHLPQHRGLSDVLDGDVSLADATLISGEGATLLVGSRPETLRHLLASPGAEDLFAELRTVADTVVIVGPSAGEAPAQSLGRLSDVVVPVVQLSQTRRATLADAIEQMHAIHATLLGVVVVAKPSWRDRFESRRPQRQVTSRATTPPPPVPAIPPAPAAQVDDLPSRAQWSGSPAEISDAPRAAKPMEPSTAAEADDEAGAGSAAPSPVGSTAGSTALPTDASTRDDVAEVAPVATPGKGKPVPRPPIGPAVKAPYDSAPTDPTDPTDSTASANGARAEQPTEPSGSTPVHSPS